MDVVGRIGAVGGEVPHDAGDVAERVETDAGQAAFGGGHARRPRIHAAEGEARLPHAPPVELEDDRDAERRALGLLERTRESLARAPVG